MLHLLAGFARRPELTEGAFAHPGGEVTVEAWILRTEACDKLFDGLPCGVSVVRTWRRDGSEAVQGNGIDDLLLTEVDERADDGDARLVKVGLGTEGVELS